MESHTPAKIIIENVNHPGQAKPADAAMYQAMKQAILEVLPAKSPGMTVAEMQECVRGRLPEQLYPDGAKSGWWTKAVQLDLEAKGIITREKVSPLRLHKA
ncbi:MULTISPECIES: DUF6958 family protein [Aminobacter]|jgi:hypothetical protein|uniref:Uncharacterized protein n=2 Tax=Aminobacter TaxID=31988 RepID=A0AAC9AR16_AMIAI|nr:MULTISPECIES: hypothetical protein [Aminobacter]AMS41263.1 hypothetical protein AA2016_2337 [Aminobacter aminovorans]MBA8910014.1 hypothetical protein [Aminobacter ciceronei]MBA9023792.1 hypothetical protein [Aminobacter ciceronei]MBB3705753.1 hypothetical protein [Aminobacter aminovorans]MRX36388.1 hypothetical protein [Aminobacter sp. MDW-2]